MTTNEIDFLNFLNHNVKFPSHAASKPSETLIFLDWDDTCLPSSHLGKNKVLKKELVELETKLYRFLTLLLKYGQVVIVTSAETNWVESSCNSFLKQCTPLLQHIQIVSARSTYRKNKQDYNQFEWKRRAFSNIILSQNKKKKPLNILSFGDSEFERLALQDVVIDSNEKHLLKTVKFFDNPTIVQLENEIGFLMEILPTLHDWPLLLDLQLSKKINK